MYLWIKTYQASVIENICAFLTAVFSNRYADRAKKIKNKAVVNENPMDKLIRELREENEKLKKMFEGGGLTMDYGGREMSMYNSVNNYSKLELTEFFGCVPVFQVLNCYDCCPGDAEKEEMRKKMKDELLAQMEFNAQSMMSWDEKVKGYQFVHIYNEVKYTYRIYSLIRRIIFYGKICLIDQNLLKTRGASYNRVLSRNKI